MKNSSIKSLFQFSIFICISVIFTNCEESGDDSLFNFSTDSGFYISNEGNFDASNASISYYDQTVDSVVNDVFLTVNNIKLGDVAQSVKEHGDKAYVVVNNSGKVEVINRSTAVSIATIEGLEQPRFIAFDGEKGFISQWGSDGISGKIAVFNTTTNEVTDTIEMVGSGPENMVIVDGKLFVANSGGYGKDSTVTVIDTETETIINTIELDFYNPKDFAVDKNNMLWILCYGLSDWSTGAEYPSSLVKYNVSGESIDGTIHIADSAHPSTMAINPDGDMLYVGSGYAFAGIYRLNISDTEFPANKFLDKSAYGFSVNKNNGNIIVFESPDFTSRGVMTRYSSDGTQLGTYEVGIAPSNSSLKRAILNN